MKKTLLIIIGTILILLISFGVWHRASSAKAESVLDTCKIKELNTYLYETAFKNLQTALDDTSDTDHNDLKIRLAFERARTKYHDGIKCVFDVATIKMLGSASGIAKSIKNDDLPDLTKEVLADLNKPDKACAVIEQGLMKEIIENDGPANLVEKLLQTHGYYSDFIKYLINIQSNRPTIPPGYIGLEKIADNMETLQLIMENEIQDSIVALDTAFLALKEMRVSFVMHMQFQCMLKNLEAYRKLLGNLRKMVMTAPGLVIDASMHK